MIWVHDQGLDGVVITPAASQCELMLVVEKRQKQCAETRGRILLSRLRDRRLSHLLNLNHLNRETDNEFMAKILKLYMLILPYFFILDMSLLGK